MAVITSPTWRSVSARGESESIESIWSPSSVRLACRPKKSSRPWNMGMLNSGAEGSMVTSSSGHDPSVTSMSRSVPRRSIVSVTTSPGARAPMRSTTSSAESTGVASIAVMMSPMYNCAASAGEAGSTEVMVTPFWLSEMPTPSHARSSSCWRLLEPGTTSDAAAVIMPRPPSASTITKPTISTRFIGFSSTNQQNVGVFHLNRL